MVVDAEGVVLMAAVAAVAGVVLPTSKVIDVELVNGAYVVEIDVVAARVLVKVHAVVKGAVVSTAVAVVLVAADMVEREDLVMEVEEAEGEEEEGARAVEATDVVVRPTGFVMRGVGVMLGDVVGAAVVAADVFLGGAVERETVVVAGIFVVSTALKVLPARVVAVTEDCVTVLAVGAVVAASVVLVNVD